MNRYGCIVAGIIFAGLTASRGIPAQGAKSETEGTWEIISLERDGKEVKPQKDTKLIVTGATFVVKVGDKVIAAGTGKLDPTKKPKTIDTVYTEGSDKGKSFKGIYQLDGDTLKFCRPGSPDSDRPTEFKTTAGRGGFVSVYRRVKN